MKQVIGYVSPWSVAPGETLRVHVGLRGGATEYAARVVRVLCADTSEDGPGADLRHMPSEADGVRAGVERRTAPGSYARAALPAGGCADGFAMGCFVFPTLPGGVAQPLLFLAAGQSGWGLEIDASGHLAVCAGAVCAEAGRFALELKVTPRAWQFVWLSHDRRLGRLAAGLWRPARGFLPDVRCRTVVEPGVPDPPAWETLLLAARPGPDGPVAGFEGKLERPVLFAGAVSGDEMLDWAACHAAGMAPARAPDGQWEMWLDPAAPAPGRLRGRGALAGDAETVNLPSRAVTSLRWDGTWHDWRARPDHYDAVEFHADDLIDAGWPADIALAIPLDWPSGVYAVELAAGGDVTTLPFFLRPPRDRATAEIAFLASTFTSIAYANYRFHLRLPEEELMLGGVLTLSAEDVYLLENDDVGPSAYDTHRDGAGVRHASRLRPVLNMGPTSELWNLSEDTHLLAWLARAGRAVDVITDEDVHEEGVALLGRYRCVLSGSHPEYVTTPLWQAVAAYLAQGGRWMALGGNQFYWRIGMYAEHPGTIELRRAEGGARFWAESPGEYVMASTGELGGLWARSGTPPNALIGVGTRAIGFRGAGHYLRTAAGDDPRARFIFAGVAAARIGDFGAMGGGAAGFEMDAADVSLGTPAHALVVASSAGLPDTYQPVPETTRMPFSGQHAAGNPLVRADMVFFETASGGAVFAAGSMSWLASLAWDCYDNDVARVTGNVLRRFLDATPFPAPPDPAR